MRLEDCGGWRDLSGIVYTEFWLRVVLLEIEKSLFFFLIVGDLKSERSA